MNFIYRAPGNFSLAKTNFTQEQPCQTNLSLRYSNCGLQLPAEGLGFLQRSDNADILTRTRRLFFVVGHAVRAANGTVNFALPNLQGAAPIKSRERKPVYFNASRCVGGETGGRGAG